MSGPRGRSLLRPRARFMAVPSAEMRRVRQELGARTLARIPPTGARPSEVARLLRDEAAAMILATDRLSRRAMVWDAAMELAGRLASIGEPLPRGWSA